jgi:AcrR family transcriptional regulator
MRQGRGTERRDRIVAEAIELFAAKGFRGSSIAELAARVEMTHPGLLYWFGTKERLLLDVVAERERREVDALLGGGGGPEASLARLPDVARFAAADAVMTRLYAVLAAENLDDGDPLHAFFVDRYERARRVVVLGVEQDRARGEVRADVDAEQVAREVIATLIGLEVQWLMDATAFDYVAAVEAYVDGLRARLAP